MSVKGYTPLSQQQLDDMNSLKEMEEQCLRLIESIRFRNDDSGKVLYSDGYGNNPDIEGADLLHGTRQLKDAFMWLNRAIAKPGRVKLAGD